MSPDLGIPFQLTDVDGVPCFWADAPGPVSAGLLFRVGRADEQLASGGVTGLVQHVALSGFGGRRYAYDARVDSTTASFYATGTPEEVAEFLRDVGRALGEFHDDGYRPAGDPEEPTTLARVLMMRFGAVGHGLPFYEPFGLRRLEPEHLAAWAASWFTRGNAALWMTCPPPTGLRLDLPDGQRIPPPEPQTMPGLELPAFAASGDGCVASSMVARRSAAIAVAGRTVAGRARAELDEDARAWQFPLTADLTHRFLSLDAGDDAVAPLAAIYDSVAADGPTRDELAEAAQATTDAVRADEAVPGGLERMAVDELLGAPPRWKEDLIHEAESVSYAEAAAALREAMTTQILVAPASAARPGDRLHDYPWFSPDRPQGQRCDR